MECSLENHASLVLVIEKYQLLRNNSHFFVRSFQIDDSQKCIFGLSERTTSQTITSDFIPYIVIKSQNFMIFMTNHASFVSIIIKRLSELENYNTFH